MAKADLNPDPGRATLKTAPAAEPVTLVEVKAQVRVDNTASDTLLTDYIVAARQAAENLTWRALVTQTWEYRPLRFEAEILLPRPPLISVGSIVYIDTAGDSQTLAATEYQVDTNQEPGRVKLAHNKSWPSIRSTDYGAVLITYDAGYGAASAVPLEIRRWITSLVAQMFQWRELSTERALDHVPFLAHSLVSHYRAWF